MLSKMESTELVIQGTLFPAKWDERGEIKDLILDTDDQDEYLIAQTGKGKELIGLIHKKMTLIGVVREVDKGPSLFHVRDYRIDEKSPENENQNI